MNTHSKKELQKQLADVENQLLELNKKKEQLQKQLSRKELILPFCVKRNDSQILMQGGDEMPSTLYANLHCALTREGKRITPLNLTRLWGLYAITKQFTADKKDGAFSLQTSIGKKWYVSVFWEGNTQVVRLLKEGTSKPIHVNLKYRFTLSELILCLDIMSR